MESSILPKKIIVLIGLLCAWCGGFVLVSCQPPATENRMEQIAKGCCECTTHLIELNRQAAQSPDKADFKVLEAEFNRTKACLATVSSHFGKLKTEEIPQLEKQLQPKCPQLAAQHDLLRQLLAE
ncbi:MAG: hypothetical protein ABIQ93_00075 [Saprospiraceae bacterium]